MRVAIEVVADSERRLQEALSRQSDAGVNASRRVLERACRRIVPLARALAPDDPTTSSGDLKGSIRLSKSRVNRKTQVVSAGVVAGGGPLLPRLRATGHRINAVAPVQEKGEGKVGPGRISMAPLHHATGRSPFLWPPFAKEAEAVPGELLTEVDREVKSAL